MSYTPSIANTDAIIDAALDISTDGCRDIATLLSDISTDAKIDVKTGNVDPATMNGGDIAFEYGAVLGESLSVSTANGAMVIDDLMQKISTKVQVAAQMLSAANNMAKTASRILSQG